MQLHNIKISIEKNLLFLARKAILNTIRQRGYWGLADELFYPKAFMIEEDASKRYKVQTHSVSEEDRITDKIIHFELLDSLKDEFIAYGMSPIIDVEIEMSGETAFSKDYLPSVHSAYCNFLEGSTVDCDRLERLNVLLDRHVMLLNLSE